MKMDGSFLEEKPSFKMLRLSFSSILNWGSNIISIAKTASKKIGASIRSNYVSVSLYALYLYKSTLHCCHGWAGAPGCHLKMLDKLQNAWFFCQQF